MSPAAEAAMIDEGTVRSFVQMVHDAAASALKGASDPGVLQLDFLHPNGGSMQTVRFSTTCCKGKHPTTGTPVACPFFTTCAYQNQLRDKPGVWVVAHDLLFRAQAALGEVAAVVIDEGFWQAGIKAPGKGMTLDEVGPHPHSGPLGSATSRCRHRQLSGAPWRLRFGLQAIPGGPR